MQERHACMSSMHVMHACHPTSEGGQKSRKKSKSQNVRKPSETIGNLREPLDTLRKPSESLRTHWKPSKTFKKGLKKQVLERNGSNFGLRSSRPDRVNPLDRGTSRIKVLANVPLRIEGKLDFSRLLGRIPN